MDRVTVSSSVEGDDVMVKAATETEVGTTGAINLVAATTESSESAGEVLELAVAVDESRLLVGNASEEVGIGGEEVGIGSEDVVVGTDKVGFAAMEELWGVDM